MRRRGKSNEHPQHYEPRHEKTNVLVSDLVRLKPGCTAREDDLRLEISHLESRGISQGPKVFPQRQNFHRLQCIFMFTRKFTMLLLALANTFLYFWCHLEVK